MPDTGAGLVRGGWGLLNKLVAAHLELEHFVEDERGGRVQVDLVDAEPLREQPQRDEVRPERVAGDELELPLVRVCVSQAPT